MTVEISNVTFHVVNLETRLPFHFGNIEVTEIPKLFLQIEADIDGATEYGIAMGGLMPGWFYKDPEMSLETGYRNMIKVFRSAADIAREMDPTSSAFAFWRSLYRRQREWASTEYPALLWSYGVSLVEQALIEAVCREKGVTFARAVRENLLGIDIGSVYDELDPFEPVDLLPNDPRGSVALRHTVGLDDPLIEADVTTERPDDSLPVSLAEYVREDGVNHFKIKLSADRERDADRLTRIAGVIADLDLGEYLCTVDANEGYSSANEFKRQWEAHTSDADHKDLLDRLAYVEQPLPRDEAFTPETKETFRAWHDAPPIIIDESDGRIDSTATALEHGYAGTSHKNCKGVFKTITNACLIAHRNRSTDGQEYVISTEDLTTTGPIEVGQDLAVAATIGAGHVERNGHHYFKGLDAFPATIQERVLEHHDDLYRAHDDGFATLAIDDGTLDLESTLNAPFGVGPRYDVDRFTPLDAWLDGMSG